MNRGTEFKRSVTKPSSNLWLGYVLPSHSTGLTVISYTEYNISQRVLHSIKIVSGYIRGTEFEVSVTNHLQVYNSGIVPAMPDQPRLDEGQHDALHQHLSIQLVSKNGWKHMYKHMHTYLYSISPEEISSH